MDYPPFALNQDESDALEQILGDMYVTDLAHIDQAPVALETVLAASSPWPAQQQQQLLPLPTGLDPQPPPPNPNPDLDADPSRPRRTYVEIASVSPLLTEAPKRQPPLPLLDSSSTVSSSEGATMLTDPTTDSTFGTPDDIEFRRKAVSVANKPTKIGSAYYVCTTFFYF